MNIEEIEIKNFKSIENEIIHFKNYGKGINESKTTFLVGLNESGKSAILEAISFLNKDFDIDYEDYCYKPSIDQNEYIEINAKLSFKIDNYWQNLLMSKCGLPRLLINNLKIKELRKEVFTNNKEYGSGYVLTLENTDFYNYLVENGEIHKIRHRNNVKKTITSKNCEDFLQPNQVILSKKLLENTIASKLHDEFDLNMPNVQVWSSKKEYLINEEINLNNFKTNTELSVPLRNIFHLSGFETDEQIKNVIERALKKQEKCDELREVMSEATTKHLKNVWKEHKVEVKVSINGELCKVFIQDSDKKHNYFTIEQRSEGFKQFMSLILSLSILNDKDKLKGNIILIDEPEVHLHPSGVRYMRDELLKIGKNNHLFVSTHSHYMVDTNCPERHWIIKKEKAKTSINPISENTPIESDDVLLSAFGLNLFKELLPQNILVVEGGDDKEIINHVFKLSNISNYSIKSAGGASKSPGIASILINESVPAYILFDDDKEGKDNKKRILDKFQSAYNSNNVFTLKDLVKTLPINSTIEDLMPLDFVNKFFSKELDNKFTIEEGKAIIIQLKNQDTRLKEKQKLESLKVKLSKEFISTYKAKSSLSKIPLLVELRDKLLDKWK